MVEEIAHALIIENGRYLALRENGKDYWKLPGGRLNSGELPEDALRRELYEEIGVKIKSAKKIHEFETLFKGRTLKFYSYLVDVDGLARVLDEEEDLEMDWQLLDRMKDTTDQEPSQQILYNRLIELGIVEEKS